MIELYPETCPQNCGKFYVSGEKGFYDGLIFHRVISGFMIQGGCPEGTGMVAPGYQIQGEFQANGFQNPLKHERGVISMARAMDPNSAGSQFFYYAPRCSPSRWTIRSLRQSCRRNGRC